MSLSTKSFSVTWNQPVKTFQKLVPEEAISTS